MDTHYIEHGKTCEIVSNDGNTYTVRIRNEKENEVIEKTVNYKPLPIDGWKYKDGDMFKKEDEILRVSRYTTYVKNGEHIYAYMGRTQNDVGESLYYEKALDELAPDLSNQFLSSEQILMLDVEMRDEIQPLEAQIVDLKEKIKDIRKNYDIESKCFHEWTLMDTTEDGRNTTKEFNCVVCGKTRHTYSYRIC